MLGTPRSENADWNAVCATYGGGGGAENDERNDVQQRNEHGRDPEDWGRGAHGACGAVGRKQDCDDGEKHRRCESPAQEGHGWARRGRGRRQRRADVEKELDTDPKDQTSVGDDESWNVDWASGHEVAPFVRS